MSRRKWETTQHRPIREEAFDHDLPHYRLLEPLWLVMRRMITLTIRMTLERYLANRNSSKGKTQGWLFWHCHSLQRVLIDFRNRLYGSPVGGGTSSPEPYYGNRSSAQTYEVERNVGEDAYASEAGLDAPSTSTMPTVTPSASRASLRRGPSVTFALPPEKSYNTPDDRTSTPVKHLRYQREISGGQDGGFSSTAGAVVVDNDGTMVPVEPVLSTSSSIGGAAGFALTKSVFTHNAGEDDAEPRGRQSLVRQRWMKAYKSVCEQLGRKVSWFLCIGWGR